MNAVFALFLATLAPQAVEEDKVDPTAALKEFKKNYKDDPVDAIQTLGHVQHKKTLSVLARFLSAGRSNTRIAAAEALGGFEEFKKYASPMLMMAFKANKKSDFTVKDAILKSLAALGDPRARLFICSNYENKDFQVAVASVKASGTDPNITALDALYKLNKKVEQWIKRKQGGNYVDKDGKRGKEADQQKRIKTLQKAIVTSFQSITGESWATSAEWDLWFKKRRRTFKIQ